MVLCSVALVAGIVAAAINMWQTQDNAGILIKSGLWKSCFGDTCVDINLEKDVDSEKKSSLQAVRALVIIGILVMAASIACAVLWLFVMKENAMLTLIGGVAAAIGGVMFLAAMAVFAAKKDETADLSAGFAIDIVGWILAWAGAGVLIFAKVKAE